MNIRRAVTADIDGISKLLQQVNNVHADGRPDIFIHDKRKYTADQLCELLADVTRPIFVAVDDEGAVMGYCFCIFEEPATDNMQPIRTLYIDDLCVDSELRGRHIGTELYRFTRDYAAKNGFYHITLNVWNLNTSAMRFYESCGLTPLKVTMEDILPRD